MTQQTIALSLIRIDGGTQLRVKNDEDAIVEYAQRLEDGQVPPPVDVFFDGVSYWLAHGFHRYHSAILCGRTEIEAIVHKGAASSAILFACGANADNGVCRTNEDKRNAVRAALLVYEGKGERPGDEQIADACRVSTKFVTQLRNVPKLRISPKVLGKDGKTYDTTNIGKGKPKPVTTGKAAKSILSRVITDTRAYADVWASMAARPDPRWLEAPKEEVQTLIDALTAVRRAVTKAINGLNKEA